MWIELKWGHYVNTDHVAEFRPVKAKPIYEYALYGRNGDKIGTFEDTQNQLDTLLRPVIPASADTFVTVVTFDCDLEDEEALDVTRERVVAWRICEGVVASPILAGSGGLHDNCVILVEHANGTYEHPMICTYGSLEEAKKSIIERVKRDKEREKSSEK